jgi:hypothetical protein
MHDCTSWTEEVKLIENPNYKNTTFPRVRPDSKILLASFETLQRTENNSKNIRFTLMFSIGKVGDLVVYPELFPGQN